jgi:hypothetical protein
MDQAPLRLQDVLPGQAHGCPARTRVESPNASRSAGSSSSGRIKTRTPVNHFFTLLGQVLIMPQAAVGIRPPAGKPGRARIPRVSWTTLEMPKKRLPKR